MLEVFAINICVPTKEGDFYDKVAINPHPIIVWGRRSDLENLLKSQQVIEWLKQHIRTEEVYSKAEYNIVKCNRDNTAEKITLNCKELTGLIF